MEDIANTAANVRHYVVLFIIPAVLYSVYHIEQGGKNMYKILDDVRKDAIQKCKPTGEEDNKILVDAAVLILELTIYACDEGLLALEEKTGKMTVNDFLKRIIMLVVDGTDPKLVAEIGSNEYWARNPQGIQAMVLYIYLWGTGCIQYGDYAMAFMGIYSLLPESRYLQLGRQIVKLEEKRKLLEKEEQERDLKWEERRELTEKALQDYLCGPPVLTNQELLEIVHALEEQIEKLPDAFLKKVLYEMGEERYHCFYVFNDKIRQRILKLADDSFIQQYRESLVYFDHTKPQKLEEEEILGAVLVMSGIIKCLSKQEK